MRWLQNIIFMTDNRIYKYDNVKFICILLVVIGHAVDEFTDKSGLFKSIFLFVYSFHMPIFLFISGLFQKKLDKTSRFNINKFTGYLVIGYLLKLLNFVIKSSDHANAKIKWFGGDDIPWFMMVLAAYVLIVFLISRIKIHPLIVMALSVIIACAGGYVSYIGDRFWISRILVFMPFYLAGYYLTPQKVMDFTRKLYVRIPAILLGLGWTVLCFAKRDMVYPLRMLFTGRNAFAKTAIAGCGFEHRLLCYAISAVMCIAIISVIPNIKVPLLTHMGANTMAVFFWHTPIIRILEYTGVLNAMLTLPKYTWMALTLAGALVAGFGLMFDVFSWPLNKTLKGINSLGRKGCVIILVLILIFGIAFTIREGI